MAHNSDNNSFIGIGIASILVLVAGIGLGWYFKSEPTTAPIKLATNQVLNMQTPANTFASAAFDVFPEAYHEFSYFGFFRDAHGNATPHEVRMYVPARLFGGEFKVSEGILDNVGQGYQLDEQTLTRETIPQRLDDLGTLLIAEDVARCPNFKVGPVRDIRHLDWPDTRVRELKIELHLGC